MKELTNTDLEGECANVWEDHDEDIDRRIELCRRAIAAHVALNADDFEPMKMAQIEVIADPTLRAVCEAYTNTPGGHFGRLQAVARLLERQADLASHATPQVKQPAEHNMMPEHWQVMVEREGEVMLTISDQHIAGVPDADENLIVGAARHLLSFVGYGLPPSRFEPDEDTQTPQPWGYVDRFGAFFKTRPPGLAVTPVYDRP